MLKREDLLKEPVKTTYVTVAKHCKYSVSDQVYKIYNHKLYKAFVESELLQVTENDSKYKWMTIEDLESDEAIM